MYRHQLSGMVNCASATTIAGQNAIGELASKIDTTMERLDAVAALKAGDASEKLQGSAAAPETHPLAEQGGEAAAPGSTSTQTEAQRLAPTGALLNVFV